ncbi:MAG: Gfo/Idh/MocA family oxidoreductase [Spirochaetales bacterium]|nr:Gfo/Idh/MocA family oxidoreductase [Spirochaetales bacterium]
MDKIKIAVAGAGFMGRMHCQYILNHPQAEVVGIFNPTTEKAEAAAKEYSISKVYKHQDELFSSPDIDAVVIASPNKQHVSMAISALSAGKHVLLEKPMALNSQEAAEIVEAQKKAGTTLMIAHQMRWYDLTRQIIDLREAGAIGKIYNAKAAMWRTCSIPGWGSWFTRKEESGGGPLIDIGVHALDLAFYMMGNPTPVSVFGSTYAEFGPSKKGIGSWGTPNWDGFFDVEDMATAMIKMEDGSTLTLEVSWAANTDPKNKEAFHIMGNKGGASLYGDTGLYINQEENKTLVTELSLRDNGDDPRALLIDHFIDCVKTGKQPISDGLSGLRNMMILDAISESAKTGDIVRLDPALLK